MNGRPNVTSNTLNGKKQPYCALQTKFKHITTMFEIEGKTVFLKLWRLFTLVLTALTTGMSFSHVLELPAKRRYDTKLYLSVQKSLYDLYGTAGVTVEGSWLFALVLLFFVRKRRSVFLLTLAGTLCLIVAQAVWWAFVRPVNAQVIHWTTDSLPANWRQLRDRWEYAHAGRFVLHLAGFTLLLLSILQDVSETTKSPSMYKDGL